MASIIDDTEAIARRMREIEEENAPARSEPVVDGAYVAVGEFLDKIALYHGVRARERGETDESLRDRIVKQITRPRYLITPGV